MSRSDRAFRALARAQPDIIAGLLAAVAPGLLPAGAVIVPDDVAPTHIDGLPPELDADFASRVDESELLHMECQGYRDGSFEARTLWYHVGHALRNRGKRRVRTVALWLTLPLKGQRKNRMTVDDITVKVTTLVLQEIKASVLLADPRTACFAAGAHLEGRTIAQLCAQVAAALRARNASWAERHMAVVAAATQGRYKEMVKAMEDVHMEPVIIEDLVKFGEDRGLRKGLFKGERIGERKGERKGRVSQERETLRRVLALRKLELSAEQARQIDACTSLEMLKRWHDQAIFATSAAEALR